MRSILALMLLAFSGSAFADCDASSCTGIVREINLFSGTTSVAVASADAADVTICVATGNGGLGTFRLPSTHDRYQEMFAVIHAAAVTGRSVGLIAASSPGQPCQIAGVFVPY